MELWNGGIGIRDAGSVMRDEGCGMSNAGGGEDGRCSAPRPFGKLRAKVLSTECGERGLPGRGPYPSTCHCEE